MKSFCDNDCNNCRLISDKNSPILTAIFNELLHKLGVEVYEVVQKHCPNLTCCAECHVDDFLHFSGCTIMEKLGEQ
jgi:hypothetical protein